MRHGMDILAETYLKYSPMPIEALIGKKGKGQKSMRDVEPDIIKEYAVEDADITFQLKEVFAPMLEHTGTRKLFDEIEIPLMPVLAAMEQEGINLDTGYLKELSAELFSDIKTLEQKIYETAGEPFNLASPKQLGEVLFDRLNMLPVKKCFLTWLWKTQSLPIF
jgi:DNA polymerase-1